MFGENYVSDTPPASPNSHLQRGPFPSHPASATALKSNTAGRPLASDGHHEAVPRAAPHSILQHDSGPPGGHQLKSVAEIIQELDAEQHVSGPKGGCCSRVFIPFVVAGLLLILFMATVWTAGNGVDVEASPRAAIIILEGFKGTIFEELLADEVHLPNIAAMMSRRGGVHANCPDPAASSCARTVLVENDVTGGVYTASGSSIASILSGVTPRRHKVLSDTRESYADYATTSKTYPSIARRVMEVGKTVTVLGTAHLINSFGPNTGRCTEPGVLDIECITSREKALADMSDPLSPSTSLECLASSTCNIATRRMKLSTNPLHYSEGIGELQFTHQLREVFGGLTITQPDQSHSVQNIVADAVQDSLFIFHFDALAVRAQSGALPACTYSADSKPYVAQAYLLDALVGQIVAFLRDRALTQKENWLVVGVSDHGGLEKSFDQPRDAPESQVVPFFLSTYTANARGFVSLQPLVSPVSVLDVLPTVLRWLNVAPYDELTQQVLDGVNATPVSGVEASLGEREMFEGQVQGVCSSGIAPKDCKS